jgi:mRNA interferase RelE/StbE
MPVFSRVSFQKKTMKPRLTHDQSRTSNRFPPPVRIRGHRTRLMGSLDSAVKVPLRKVLKAGLENPHVIGNALRGDLLGCDKIKLLTPTTAQRYRLIYKVLDTKLIVPVIAVAKRDKDAVYKVALKRLREAAARSRP